MIYADLHIHGRFSRATSKDLSIEQLAKYAKMKGLSLIGTGDFTHPSWIAELKSQLREEEGILKSEHELDFILQAELSNVYMQDGKIRKVHNILLAPSFEIVEQINDYLKTKGKLTEDGRPTFTFSCAELVEKLMSISKEIMVIPAHAWTPWFSVFGSKSGFNSMEECFQDQVKHIFALETGLSSDPLMNRRLSSLDKYVLISNSDSHSFWPWRIGRECNAFELKDLTYSSLTEAIKDNDAKKFLYTIEVDPAYGKYHFDGHRLCNVCLSPSESKKFKGRCPKCGRLLTIGVLNRVEELADREEGFVLKDKPAFYSIIPLSEIISAVLNIKQLYSDKIWLVYNRLIEAFGSEFNVLLNASREELEKNTDKKIADIIIRMRMRKLAIQPGYDGVYGHLNLNENEASGTKKFKTLKDFIS